MIRKILNTTVHFDCEWIPCARTIQRLHGLDPKMAERDVFAHAWKHAGADDKNPTPFLKLALSKVVSISALIRQQTRDGLQLELISFPANAAAWRSEKCAIESFLETVASMEAQLVSFNGSNADLPVLIQRGALVGARCPEFSKRPEKPWMGRDYFSANSDAHIDVMRILGGGGFGKSVTPTLAEAAAAGGFPGKLGTTGSSVAEMWLAGDHNGIIRYNQLDCVVTYLLWLKATHFAGLMTTAQHAAEIQTAQEWLASLALTNAHLAEYLVTWLNIEGDTPSVAA